MSTVKISQLPLLTSLNANTANSLFMGVDLPTGTTGKFTAHTLAQGLFSNEILAVGVIQQNLPNTVAQFSQSGESYIQTNLVNTNDGGTADIVVTANTGSGGTDAANFIDMGWANKNYQPGSEFNNIGNAVNPNDGYLYAQGTSGQPYGNLIIGTTSTSGQLKFIAGGGQASNVVAKMTSTGLTLNTQSYITFADGSTQNVAYNPGTEATQNTRLNSIESINTNQNTSISVIQGVDTTQNTLIAIMQGVDLTQNTNITTANNAAWAGFDVANAAFALANTVSGRQDRTTIINAEQNTSINLAWTKANNALANTSGVTTAGSLNVSGNLIVTGLTSSTTANIGNLTISNNVIYSSLTSSDITIGQSIATANLVINRTTNITKNLSVTANLVVGGSLVDFNNSTFDPNVAFIQITGSDNAVAVSPSNTNYMLQITGKGNSATRLVLDSFGANAYPVLVGRTGRGTTAALTATQNNDVMMRIVGNGYTGTQFAASSPTKIDFVASENFSNTNRGTQIQFWNTTMGSNVIQKIATFNADTVSFTGTVNPGKGFVYSPTIYPGAQTAIMIDVSNNSLVRAQTSTGLVVTLTNLMAGKEVVAWITNTAGTNQTFTHGCSALNSTVNATTYNIPSTSTILVRYMCIDTTAQNTFVAITKA